MPKDKKENVNRKNPFKIHTQSIKPHKPKGRKIATKSLKKP